MFRSFYFCRMHQICFMLVNLLLNFYGKLMSHYDTSQCYSKLYYVNSHVLNFVYISYTYVDAEYKTLHDVRK